MLEELIDEVLMIFDESEFCWERASSILSRLMNFNYCERWGLEEESLD